MDEHDKRSGPSWLEARRLRRAARRELRADRRGRGTKKGDVLYDAAARAESDMASTGGFFSSGPTKRK